MKISLSQSIYFILSLNLFQTKCRFVFDWLSFLIIFIQTKRYLKYLSKDKTPTISDEGFLFWWVHQNLILDKSLIQYMSKFKNGFQ